MIEVGTLVTVIAKNRRSNDSDGKVIAHRRIPGSVARLNVVSLHGAELAYRDDQLRKRFR